MKPIRVDERDAVFLPVRVCRLHRLSADALACLVECVRATEIQDEQAVRVGGGPAVFAARRELEMRFRPGLRQEDPVVTVVILEVADLA